MEGQTPSISVFTLADLTLTRPDVPLARSLIVITPVHGFTSQSLLSRFELASSFVNTLIMTYRADTRRGESSRELVPYFSTYHSSFLSGRPLGLDCPNEVSLQWISRCSSFGFSDAVWCAAVLGLLAEGIFSVWMSSFQDGSKLESMPRTP